MCHCLKSRSNKAAQIGSFQELNIPKIVQNIIIIYFYVFKYAFQTTNMPTKCNSAHTSLQNDQGPKSTNLCIITPHRAPTKCRPWIREKNIGISAHQAEKNHICLLFFFHSNSLHKVVHLLTFWPPARPRPRTQESYHRITQWASVLGTCFATML